MRNTDKYERLFSLLSSAVLIVLLSSVFGYIWYENYASEILIPFYRKGNWLLIVIYAVITILFFNFYNAFNVSQLRRGDIICSQIIALVCVNIITYLQVSLIGRQFMYILPIVIMTAAQIMLLTIWTLICNAINRKMFPPQKLVIVYSNQQAEEIIAKMSVRDDKYIIGKAIYTDNNFDEICSQVKEFDGVILSDVPENFRDMVINFCYLNGIRLYIYPSVSDILLRGAENLSIFDSPILHSKNYALGYGQELLKRIFDIVFSIFALLIFSPFFIIIPILIYSEDRGKIFYLQTRLTKNSKEFKVIKFRSMIENAEDDGAKLASKTDDRITKIGKFIRASRIDELPQFFNVIKGDMSLVGPRPERPEFYEEYSKICPEFNYRLKVKAGLTGYAQVTGQYLTSPRDKLKMDLMYIENYSFLRDIHILLLTIKTVIFPRG